MCKETHHLDCCNVPYKRFHLMEKEKKASWKCNTCINKQKSLYENITLRTRYKTAISTENSFEALSSLSSNDDDDAGDDSDNDTKQESFMSTSGHNRSCPEKTMIYDKAEKMEQIILELQEKLQIADNEIVNLLSENYSLKDKIKTQENVIDNLKKLRATSSLNNTSTQKRKTSNKTQDQSYIDLCGDQTKDCPLVINDNKTTAKNGEKRKQNHQKTYLQNPIGMSTPTNQPPILTKRTQNVKNQVLLSSPAPMKTSVSPSTSIHKKPTIYIFGDEQVRGLSRSLLNSRRGKWNDIYDLRAVVKPYASSSHIVNDLTRMTNVITKDDLIIFSAGCNDRDPFTLLTSICNMLYKFRDNNILLFNIRNNKHLNTATLNYDLEKFTKNYKNCTLVNIKNQTSWNSIVFKLNIEIDFLKYRREFIESGIKLQKLNNAETSANVSKFFR